MSVVLQERALCENYLDIFTEKHGDQLSPLLRLV